MKPNESRVILPFPASTQDRRKVARHRILWGGKLLFSYERRSGVDCLVVELSKRGARVETEWLTQVPETFYFQAGTQEPRLVRRVWVMGKAIGLEFID
ncbi:MULTISPECIES: hypothetical protein [Acidocella]|uniref:hypothetical protein n=1 Tax=Acidocella TaxID=50709 RepID=UPI001969FE4C|nr:MULTISPECIES: hypothetical protein [Acidocella]